MYRIDNSTAAPVLPTPGAAGTPGYFTDGVPGTTAATIVPGDWLNAVQEELMSILNAGGVASSKGVYTQVLQALKSVPGLAFNNSQVFTSSGSFIIPAGVVRVHVQLYGGGGGSGGAYNGGNSGGGGGGGFADGIYAVTPGQVMTVTVGAGGTAGNASVTPTAGGSGGASSFGSFCTATGGSGGAAAASTAATAGGLGGIGSGGTIANVTGGASSGGLLGSGAGGGNGGASYAMPGLPSGGYGGTGVTAVNPGCGAAGTGAPTGGSNYAGGAGAPGRVTVFW